MKLRILSIAAFELSEAIAYYYESITPGLGERFRTEVKETLERIDANPLAWSPFGDDLRRCRTAHFPYALIYTIETDSIIIVAVAHLHRDPEHWRRQR